MADATQEQLNLGDDASEEASAPKPKTRTTRTRKTKAEKEAEAAAADKGAEGAATDSAVDSAPEAAAEAKPKATRTRKKKSEVEDAPAQDASESSTAEDKPKRTRRTTKKAAVSNEAEAAEASTGAAVVVSEESANSEEPAAEQKPRRTARRASKKIETPAPLELESSKPAKVSKSDEKNAEEAVAGESDAVSASDGAKEPAADLSEGDQEASGEDAPVAHELHMRRRVSVKAKAPEGVKVSVAKEPTAKSSASDAANGSGHSKTHGQSEPQAQGSKKGDKQQNGGSNGGSSNSNGNGNNGNGKRNRKERNRKERTPREYVPSVSKEELAELKLPELREKAGELNVDASGMKKAEMIDAIYEALAIAEGFIEVGGILDILPDGYGFLRTQGYLPGEKDVYVGLSTIRRNGLRKGDYVFGRTRPAREGEKFAAIQNVLLINDMPVEETAGHRPKFAQLTPVYPDERLLMEHGKNTTTARVIDLVAPIGKGQRGLIVSPPKAGKTTILKDIAAAISANNPEVYLMCLLVDERPEEVTDMERSINGEVISSTFDMPSENHIAVAELVIERAKRLVEQGRDVVILLDSITRLARAYNLAQPASGRVLSGGVDSTALYPPKRFLGAARNIEGGGSLTILASALIETGSKMDEVIFEEFKGTGNMELRLDRGLADRRIFPAIDPVTSGTRKEDLLLDMQEAPLIWGVRRLLANMNNTERAMEMLIRSLKKTNTNQEFLMLTAKKAQGRGDGGSLDF